MGCGCPTVSNARFHRSTAPGCNAQLRAYWVTPRNPVFLFPARNRIDGAPPTATAPFDARGVQRAFQVAVQEVGLSKPATVHTLRHSWATHLLAAGVNLRLIQVWRGHAAPTTTASSTHLTHKAELLATDALDRLTAGMP